jgi:bifunctional UDP-N-acetylglucosamine pyrophosphorylase/glucosamine-1-phosphate N-acetyltransferase
MKSKLPKVLHPLAGQPIVSYAVDTATQLSDSKPIIIVGCGAEQVRAALGDAAIYVEQREQLGTGHAVLQVRPLLENRCSAVLVFYADMPLLRAETLRRLVELGKSTDAAIALLTVRSDDSMGFGRVVRDETGSVVGIVEEADAAPQQLAIRELNSGVYCFQADWLWSHLDRLPMNRKGEYYLTDLVSMAVAEGQRVEALVSDDIEEMLGINNRVHLARAEAIVRQRIRERLMLAGVTLIDPPSVFIDATVEIGPDTTVYPNTTIQGRTRIGSDCAVGPNSLIRDSTIGDGCRIVASMIEGSVIEDKADVGPFSHLRSGSHLGKGAHVGNFVEMKKSRLGEESKAGHFSYLGDATVGANVNIGAGTITCNFDGERKHPTVIEDDVFIGSDSMLVAPLHIGRGAKTGAGSVVTHDVPDGALVYGVPARSRKPVGQNRAVKERRGTKEKRGASKGKSGK